MLPMSALRYGLATLQASDTGSLNQAANANHMCITNTLVVPSENLTIASLSFATFTGSADIACPLGPMGSGIDPVTNQALVTILQPAGGYRWRCTAAPASPETIYGIALTDKTRATLWAYALLPTPAVISQVNDVVDPGAIVINFVLQPMY